MDLNRFNSVAKHALNYFIILPWSHQRQPGRRSRREKSLVCTGCVYLYELFQVGRTLRAGLGAIPYKFFCSQRDECRALNQEDRGERSTVAFAFYLFALFTMGTSAERWKSSSISERRFAQSELWWNFSCIHLKVTYHENFISSNCASVMQVTL